MGPAMNRCLKCNTENAPDAEFCINCGFSLWKDAPPAKEALDPPTEIMRIIDLHPEVVRVRRGEQATITARLRSGPIPDLEWRLSGSASSFATMRPIADGIVIELHPDRHEPAWALPLEVECVEHGDLTGQATGTVEVLGELPVDPVEEQPTQAWPVVATTAGVDPEPETRVLDTQPIDGTDTGEVQIRRVQASPARAVPIAHLVVLGACALLVLVVFTMHSYIHYDIWATLFKATVHGGDANSPLHPPDFWTIVGPTILAAVLTVIGIWIAKRGLMTIVALIGFLVLIQILEIGISGKSIREHLKIGPVGLDATHTVGRGFWLSVLAAAAIAIAAAVAAAVAQRDR
jgi:hypothetical protein